MAFATHLVKIWYYITEEGKTREEIREKELNKWKSVLGDSLENCEVIKQ